MYTEIKNIIFIYTEDRGSLKFLKRSKEL